MKTPKESTKVKGCGVGLQKNFEKSRSQNWKRGQKKERGNWVAFCKEKAGAKIVIFFGAHTSVNSPLTLIPQHHHFSFPKFLSKMVPHWKWNAMNFAKSTLILFKQILLNKCFLFGPYPLHLWF